MHADAQTRAHAHAHKHTNTRKYCARVVPTLHRFSTVAMGGNALLLHTPLPRPLPFPYRKKNQTRNQKAMVACAATGSAAGDALQMASAAVCKARNATYGTKGLPVVTVGGPTDPHPTLVRTKQAIPLFCGPVPTSTMATPIDRAREDSDGVRMLLSSGESNRRHP